MATVCKCDRCGKYVDAQVVPRIEGRFDPLRITHSNEDIKMDLCPACYRLLRNFLGYTNPTEVDE